MVQAEHRRGGEGEQGGKKTLLWPQSAGIQGKDPLLSGAIFCPSLARAASLFSLQFQISSHTPGLKCRVPNLLHQPTTHVEENAWLLILEMESQPNCQTLCLPLPSGPPITFKNKTGGGQPQGSPPTHTHGVPWWEQGARVPHAASGMCLFCTPAKACDCTQQKRGCCIAARRLPLQTWEAQCHGLAGRG